MCETKDEGPALLILVNYDGSMNEDLEPEMCYWKDMTMLENGMSHANFAKVVLCLGLS